MVELTDRNINKLILYCPSSQESRRKHKYNDLQKKIL